MQASRPGRPACLVPSVIGRYDALAARRPMSADPRIFVVIPWFEQARFLSEAIESVLAQSLPAHRSSSSTTGRPSYEIEGAKGLLQQVIGKRVASFAYPLA
jgi:hypothetical protein